MKTERELSDEETSAFVGSDSGHCKDDKQEAEIRSAFPLPCSLYGIASADVGQ